MPNEHDGEIFMVAAGARRVFRYGCILIGGLAARGGHFYPSTGQML